MLVSYVVDLIVIILLSLASLVLKSLTVDCFGAVHWMMGKVTRVIKSCLFFDSVVLRLIHLISTHIIQWKAFYDSRILQSLLLVFTSLFIICQALLDTCMPNNFLFSQGCEEHFYSAPHFKEQLLFFCWSLLSNWCNCCLGL